MSEPRTIPSTKMTVKGGTGSGESSGPKKPPIPPGLYPAVLTEVLVWERTERDIKHEMEKFHKKPEDINPFRYVWFWHIRKHKRFEAEDPENNNVLTQFDTYDRELRSETSYSMYAGGKGTPSRAYQLMTRLLGRNLEIGEEFDPADLAGTRVMLHVKNSEPNENGFVWNNVETVVPSDEDADWPTDPPPDYTYNRPSPNPSGSRRAGDEEPPHPAEAGDPGPEQAAKPRPRKESELTPAQVKLRELFDRKGFTEDERKTVYPICCNEALEAFHRFVDLSDVQQQILMEHIDHKYVDASEDDLAF